LLDDLNRMPSLHGAPVIVTLNIPEQQIDVSSYPNLQLIVVKNRLPLGFSANHNRAFGRCTTDWFVILNPDLRLADDVLPRLLAVAQEKPNTSLVAPLVINEVGDVEDSVRSNLTPLSIARRIFGTRQRFAPFSQSDGFRWFAGMCMLVRADAFRAIGGFDERYFLYCEDYDLCARLHLAGYELRLDPTSAVVHEARRASHTSLKHLYWHVMSLLRVWTSSQVWKIALSDPVPRAGTHRR